MQSRSIRQGRLRPPSVCLNGTVDGLLTSIKLDKDCSALKGLASVMCRMGLFAVLAGVSMLVAACGDATGPTDRQLNAARETIDTSYPGPADETLTSEQQTRLRERGNMQR